MELHVEQLNGAFEGSNEATLKYHGVQDSESVEEQSHSETPMVSILFDESHGQLLKSRLAKSKRGDELLSQEEGETSSDAPVSEKVDAERGLGNCQTLLGSLRSLVQDWELELEGFSSDERGLNDKVLALEKVKVLILAAPTRPLDSSEVEAVIDFVHQGGSLLIAYDYRSLYKHEQDLYERHQINNPANELLEAFGLKVKRLLIYPPQEVSTFYPHYISSEVDKLFVREPAYLEVLDEVPKTLLRPPQIVARLPLSEQPFLAAVEAEYGRVVVIADFIIFEDDYIEYGSNKRLALNIFQWLACQNSIDCFNASIQSEVKQGNTENFSITLHNPQRDRLEYIECLLESDASAEIIEPHKTIRSIARYGQTQLSWTVLPKRFGKQALKLTIDIAQQSKQESLFFDLAAQFTYVPDTEIDLVILNTKGDIPEAIETGTPFDVQAVIRQKTDINAGSLNFRLESSSSCIQVESVESTGVGRWRLNVLEAGDCPITLISETTGQKVSRLLRARPSLKDQIKAIERDTLQLLMTQLQHHASQFYSEFGSKAIQRIPCHLYTPEEQVRLIYPQEVAKQLLEALGAARIEQRTNRPLVEYLLRNISPVYSPAHGCCLPYDPELATHLRKEHGAYKENLAQNFLKLEGDDQLKFEQNIAALILHEKYGHGFFFKKTRLGKQLAILYKHGMTRNADLEQLKLPYARLLYEEYQEAIQAIWDSTVIVNEGFATWVELTVLPHLSSAVGQAAYRRKDFLFNQDKGLSLLVKSSQYFQHFPPFCESRYQEGCEYFQLIQKYFGKNDGHKCAILALLKATDIDFGISENDGRIQFGLSTNRLTEALLHREEDDARADMRLRHIHAMLQEHYEKLLTEQKRLQLQRDGFPIGNIVSTLISEKLGW